MNRLCSKWQRSCDVMHSAVFNYCTCLHALSLGMLQGCIHVVCVNSIQHANFHLSELHEAGCQSGHAMHYSALHHSVQNVDVDNLDVLQRLVRSIRFGLLNDANLQNSERTSMRLGFRDGSAANVPPL